MVCCPCIASAHYSELIHNCTHHIDGTFVQCLHCHLSFVRFVAWKVSSQKKLFWSESSLKGSNCWWIYQASGSDSTYGPFQVPIALLYVHFLGPEILTEIETPKAKLKKGALPEGWLHYKTSSYSFVIQVFSVLCQQKQEAGPDDPFKRPAVSRRLGGQQQVCGQAKWFLDYATTTGSLGRRKPSTGGRQNTSRKSKRRKFPCREVFLGTPR